MLLLHIIIFIRIFYKKLKNFIKVQTAFDIYLIYKNDGELNNTNNIVTSFYFIAESDLITYLHILII